MTVWSQSNLAILNFVTGSQGTRGISKSKGEKKIKNMLWQHVNEYFCYNYHKDKNHLGFT